MSDAELGNSACILNLPAGISISEVSFLPLRDSDPSLTRARHKSVVIPASPQHYLMSKRRAEEGLMLRFTRDISRSQLPKCFCELRLECLCSLMEKRGKK